MPRREIIEDLKEQIRCRTPKSGTLLEKAKEVLPNGEISSVRGFDPWPFYAERAEGVHEWDIDGNEYLDFCMCYGSNEYSLWRVFPNSELMGPVERPNLVPMQAGLARAAEEAMVLLPFGHEEAFKIIGKTRTTWLW